MTKETILNNVFNGTLLSRLAFAQFLYADIEVQILRDQAFTTSFDSLQKSSAVLAEHMAIMGMGKICIACSAEDQGGCCSRAIAEETDAIQLLMNMLTGVNVDIQRDNDRECSFLSDKGCIFIFKPMFCLNYNCHKIIAATTAVDRTTLERLVGDLLGQHYAIEAKLLTMINRSLSCSPAAVVF